MAEKNTKTTADLKKKKKWFPIIAPKMFNERVIGESLLEDISLLENKNISANLMNLTGDMKKQHMNVFFKVVRVTDGKGHTEILKYELSLGYIKRLVRRGKSKIEDSFVVKTSDGKFVRIKPIMVANALVKRSIQSAMLRKTRMICKEIINKNTFEIIFEDIVSYKLQKYLKDSLSKIYPLKYFEIKIFEIENKQLRETVDIKEELAKEEQEEEHAEAEEEKPKHEQEVEVIDQFKEVARKPKKTAGSEEEKADE